MQRLETGAIPAALSETMLAPDEDFIERLRENLDMMVEPI